MESRIHKNMRIIAVLSVSMITILGSTAVSPALSGIKSAFPDMSDAWIQMVLTLPTLCIIPSCLICQFMVTTIGQKKVLISGIVMYLIGGLGAGLMPDFYEMLFMRAILGLGCGLITPMAQALISSNFTGSLRDQLTSYSASASYLMGIIASMTVGKLVGINWRLAFIVYFIAVVVLILNIIYLPNQNPQELKAVKKEMIHNEKSKRKVNYSAYFTIVCMMLINMAFYTFSASISLFMRFEEIGNETSSGIVVSAFMICGFFVGLIVNKLRTIFKSATMAVGTIMMGAGYYGLYLGHHMATIIISAMAIGGSYSILYSGIFTRIRALSRDSDENTKLITITTAGMFLGQAISQSLLSFIEMITKESGYRFRFIFIAALLFISTIIIVLNVIMAEKTRRRKHE